MLAYARKEIIEIPTRNGHANNTCAFGKYTFMTWFGGTKEGADDVDIYLCRRDENGWGTPVCIVHEDGMPHWNPVLLPREDHIDLMYKRGKTIAGWQTYRLRLDGEGTPIGAPDALVPGDTGGRGPVKNKCLRLKNGRILAPSSVESNPVNGWNAFVDISDDGGETFPLHCPVPLYRVGNAPARMDKPYCVAEKAGIIQPTLWEDENGAHMLLRSSEGKILRSDSFDAGETWCPAYHTALPNNNSGIDLARMDDGRILLGLNPVSGDWAARSPLSLYVSLDGALTFQPLLTFECLPGEYSYPCVRVDGLRAFVSYTWNRVKFCYWEIELEPLPAVQ